jgi:hypothetical protein
MPTGRSSTTWVERRNLLGKDRGDHLALAIDVERALDADQDTGRSA